MAQETTHVRIPIPLKDRLNEIAKAERREQIIVLEMLLEEAIAHRSAASA
jgi:predicted transcriptional regulator